MATKLRLGYTAPIAPVDLCAEGEIHPCPDCLPWYVEFVHDPETCEPVAREWHAIDCPLFNDLISDHARGGGA